MKDFLLFLFHFSPRAAFFCEKKHSASCETCAKSPAQETCTRVSSLRMGCAGARCNSLGHCLEGYVMSAYELPAWLDTRFNENALSRTAAPDKAELRDILDKSLALKSLTIQEATALMRVTDPEDVALMMKTADAVKQKVYDEIIQK